MLKYDDVLNRQRKVIYGERRQVLEGADLHEQISEMVDEVTAGYVAGATGEGYPEEWDLDKLWQAFRQLYPISITIDDVIEEAGGDRAGLTGEFITEAVIADAQAAYERREEEFGSEVMREVERRVVLSVLDRKWREHLYEMDYLREGIGLRGYGQRDPLIEYQREGYDMFSAMMDGIKEESVGHLFNLEVQVQENPIVEEDGRGRWHAARRSGWPRSRCCCARPLLLAVLLLAVLLPRAAPGGATPPGGPTVPLLAVTARPVAAGALLAELPPPVPLPVLAGPPVVGRLRRWPGGSRARGRVGRRRDGRGAQGRTAAPRRDGVSAGPGAQAGRPGQQRRRCPASRKRARGPTRPIPAGLAPRRPQRLQYSAPSVDGGTHVETSQGPAMNDDFAHVGRNDPCPCGSGRKFKRCHGDPRIRPDA